MPDLHVGSSVVAQFTVDGHKRRYPALVASDPIAGDPDKLKIHVIGTPNDPDNLLESPLTINRVLQHGDKGEHATYRFVGEDD